MNTRTCVHHELCVIRTVQIINPNNTRGTGGHLQISVIIFFISVQMILKWPAELLKFQNKGQELIDIFLFGPMYYYFKFPEKPLLSALLANNLASILQ